MEILATDRPERIKELETFEEYQVRRKVMKWFTDLKRKGKFIHPEQKTKSQQKRQVKADIKKAIKADTEAYNKSINKSNDNRKNS